MSGAALPFSSPLRGNDPLGSCRSSNQYRTIWRAVAGFAPLAYHPPVALIALLLIGPAALLAANALAAWPQRRAARLQAGQVLRSE